MLIKLIGFIVSRPRVAAALERIAMRDPDMAILSPDGAEVYMYRGWLFNKIENGKRKYPWVNFSLRVHRIMTPDIDRHRHDHPWAARSWIMAGWYNEERQHPVDVFEDITPEEMHVMTDRGKGHIYNFENRAYHDMPDLVITRHERRPGDSARLGYDEYHRITEVAPGGALTLFAFGDYQGVWGFYVDGSKVPYREYKKDPANGQDA